MTPEEWDRRPTFRKRWEAERTTDPVKLAELRAAVEAERQRQAEQEQRAERDADRRGYKLPKERPPATSTNPEDVLDDDWSDDDAPDR